uniref:Olfactory receptor 126 n=1 Tax=Aulacocentrum confusum TaxID=2767324 RepID=A0A7G8Z9E5_9HYME|nr:olfactory receptor 126 [Aulacocentrum confusum]
MHTDILKFIQLIDTNFSMSFLAILGVNLIGMSTTGFQVLSEMNKTNEKFCNMLNSFTLILHLYFLCWYSQRLIDSSEQIRGSVEMWYDIPPRSQRLVMLVMMRSHEPCVITAGDVVVMSIETFSSGMKTALSYLTLLRSMQ